MLDRRIVPAAGVVLMAVRRARVATCGRILGAAMAAALLPSPARAQVVPPSPAAAPSTAAAAVPTPPVMPALPKGADPLAGFPKANRCGLKDAAITLVGGIDPIRDQNSFAVAAVLDGNAGPIILDRWRSQMSVMQELDDTNGDPVLMNREIAKIQAGIDAKIASLGSEENKIAFLQQREREDQAIPAAISSGRLMIVGRDGQFKCEGMAPGHYQLLAALFHPEVGVRNPSTAGAYVLQTTLFATTVDVPVPPKKKRIIVRAGRLGLIGSVDPNR